jgi:hypothetical protein
MWQRARNSQNTPDAGKVIKNYYPGKMTKTIYCYRDTSINDGTKQRAEKKIPTCI